MAQASISALDFSQLQEQLLGYKQAFLDTQGQLNKMGKDLQRLQRAYADLQKVNSEKERDLQKSLIVINKSKEKKEFAILMQENQQLRAAKESSDKEHFMQIQAFQDNMKEILAGNINKGDSDSSALQTFKQEVKDALEEEYRQREEEAAEHYKARIKTLEKDVQDLLSRPAVSTSVPVFSVPELDRAQVLKEFVSIRRSVLGEGSKAALPSSLDDVQQHLLDAVDSVLGGGGGAAASAPRPRTTDACTTPGSPAAAEGARGRSSSSTPTVGQGDRLPSPSQTRRHTALGVSVDTAGLQLQMLQEKLTNKEQELELLQGNTKRKTEYMEGNMSILAKRNRQCEDENKKLKAEIASIQTSLASLRTEKEQARAELLTLKASTATQMENDKYERSEMLKKHVETMEALREQIKGLAGERDAIVAEASRASEAHFTQLRSSVEALSAQQKVSDDTLTKLRSAEAKIAGLEAQVVRTGERFANLEAQRDKANKNVKQVHAEMAVLKSETAALQLELKAKTAKIEAKEKELQATEASFAQKEQAMQAEQDQLTSDILTVSAQLSHETSLLEQERAERVASDERNAQEVVALQKLLSEQTEATQAAEQRHTEALDTIAKLQQIVDDAAGEKRIMIKKNESLISDLKREIMAEKGLRQKTEKKNHELQMMIKVQPLLEQFRKVEKEPAKNTAKSPPKDGEGLEQAQLTELVHQLTKERDHLAVRLGEVQTENFRSESQVHYLQEEARLLLEDVHKRQAMVDYFASGHPTESSLSAHKPRHSIDEGGLTGKLKHQLSVKLGTAGDAEEKRRLASQLEQAVLNNMKLTTDVEAMQQEMKRLLLDNTRLQEKLQSAS